eukprot:Gb_22519 [translate_table: standard]
MILLYKNSFDDDAYGSMVEQLKRSLSLALVHFYPLAGCLVLGEENRHEIECNDAGGGIKRSFTVVAPNSRQNRPQARPRDAYEHSVLKTEGLGVIIGRAIVEIVITATIFRPIERNTTTLDSIMNKSKMQQSEMVEVLAAVMMNQNQNLHMWYIALEVSGMMMSVNNLNSNKFIMSANELGVEREESVVACKQAV